MPTTTFTCNKDARIAQTGSTNLGAGKSNYLPVGLAGSYLYRSLLGFSYDFTGMVSITNAVLHMKTSSQYYLGFGSDPDVNIYRLTESWSEGSADSMSTSNAVHWGNQPNADGTRHVGSTAVTGSENTWEAFDITNLMQAALAAGVFYGLRVRASNEGSSSDSTEFYAREYGSNDAYIEVTYTDNTPPTVPTLGTPPINASAQSKTPTFTFTHNDPQSDACTKYNIEVMTAAGSGTTMWASGDQTSGITGGTSISKAYGGSALSAGTPYYWRVRTFDGTYWSPWTGWRMFRTVYAPATSLSEPGANGVIAKVVYTAGSGWTTPRLSVSWSFACTDGGTQTHWRMQVGTTPGTGNLYDSGVQAGSGSNVVPTLNLTENQVVYIRVMVRCSHGEDSAWTADRNVRTRWGMARFYFDCVATPTSWSVSTLNTYRGSVLPLTADVVVEYNSAANTTPPGTYYASLASAAKNRYAHIRVWLMSWGGAVPATTPSLDKIVVSYNAVAAVPDNWTLPAGGSIDEATRVYGTQSLKIDGTGASTDRRAYQLIPVEPNTHYIMQARAKAEGAANAKLLVGPAPSGVSLAETPDGLISNKPDWDRYTLEFDSGALSEVYVQLGVFGPAGSSAWFDAVKVEAASVANPWTPGFIGEGVVLDAGGVAIDASSGGTFRLRGSVGGATDLVELATKGLKVGGPGGPELYGSSPAGGVIQTPGSWTNIRGVVLIPFAWVGTLPGSGTQDMNILESPTAIVQMRVPFAGQVVGIAASVLTARTAGSLTAQLFNGSSAALVGPTAVIDATNPSHVQNSVAPSGVGDVLGTHLIRVRLTTVGFTPVANTVKVTVWLALVAA